MLAAWPVLKEAQDMMGRKVRKVRKVRKDKSEHRGSADRKETEASLVIKGSRD